MLKKSVLSKVVVIISFILLTSVIFAAPTDLAARFIKKAGDAFKVEDFDNAYRNVNTALVMVYEDFDENNKTHQEVIAFSQMVYLKKLNLLFSHYDDLDFVEIKLNLDKYPLLKNSEIDDVISKLNDYDSNSINSFSDISNVIDTGLNNGRYDIKDNVLENEKEDLSKVLDDAAAKSMEESKRSTNIIAFAVISLSSIALIVIVIIVIVFKKGFSQQQIQQEQYIQVFKLMSSKNNKSKFLLGSVTDIYNSSNAPLQYAPSAKWTDTDELPHIEFDEKSENELKELAVKCEELGERIDSVTGRKNNSKNVSEIVYKLSLQLGLPTELSMLYFCASMVYDVGFLGVDPDILSSDILSEEERIALNVHVALSSKYLSFIPKKYYSVFEDAAKKHHENIDGSGYPKGLKGNDIPLIARLIHVAESYISISSKRAYRTPVDKETAVSQLKLQPEFYDKDIVNALDKIV